MKPVGLITCGAEPNYGACLQAFSTALAIKELGYPVEILNYSFMDDSLYSPFRQKSLKRFLGSLVVYRFRNKLCEAFREFRNAYLPYSKHQLKTKEDFLRIKDDYRVFLIGSDQVWNPELGIDIDITLLTFYKGSEGPKKVSYASSFGLSELPSNLHRKYAVALEDFEYLSVRECSGANIVHSLIDKECKVVVDPVMLRNSDSWGNYEEDSLTPREKYVLIYDLRHSVDLQKCAIALAEEKGCKVIAISSLRLPNLKIRTLQGVKPSHFLSLIHHAEAVVTDSFHGTVFSIIYNKEFYSFCSVAGKKIGGRITNVLGHFGLINRLYESYSSSINFSSIDYSEINIMVQRMREDSLSYLKNVLT